MNEALRAQVVQCLNQAGISATKFTRITELQDLLLPCKVNTFSLLDAFLSQPQLFSRSPDTLHGNVARSAELLGITKEIFVAAALRQPQLFSQSPDTLHRNIARAAELIGITKDNFIAAALRQPSLFAQSPDTLHGNVTRSAELLGVAKEIFVAAALKQPQLFYQRPDTLHSKLPYLHAIQNARGDALDPARVLNTLPSALCYGKNHLHARYIIAKLGLKASALSALITMPSCKAGSLITAHFLAQIDRSRTGTRTLQVLHAKGVLKALPSGIDPLAHNR